MPSLVARGFLVVAGVLFSIEFRKAVDDEAIAFELCLQHGFKEFGQFLWWCCVEGDGVRETLNDGRIGRLGGGVYGADGEEGEAVEGKSGDAKLFGQVIHPGEKKVGDDAIGWLLLHEVLDGGLEHGGGTEHLAEAVQVGDGGDVFDAVGKTHLMGGELNGVEAEERVGGEGFAEDLGVGGGGDDGDVVAASGEECGHVAERDHVTRC